MRLLLLTQLIPFPLDSGPKIKTYNVLRFLAGHHEVHLLSFSRSAAEAASAEALREYCASISLVSLRRSRPRDLGYLARSLWSGRPFLIERDDVSTMRSEAERLVAKLDIDAVHADQLGMAQFALDLPVSLRVLDEHNAVWTIVKRAARQEPWGPRRLMSELEWRKLRRYESNVCRRFDQVTVVSEEDRRALLGPGEEATAKEPGARCTVIPITVDSDQLEFAPRTTEARHVLSVATMFYPPNVEGVNWFATEVFPRIRAARPETLFQVVGSRPPRQIAALADQGRGVVVTGYVADLAPLLRSSAVMVVPLHSGSGMRVKILEAFARGIPVVSTGIGAEGIEVRDEEHLLIANSPADFARAVLRLLDEPALGERLSRAGRELIERRYDWRRGLAGLEGIYPETAASNLVGSAVAGEETCHPLAKRTG